MKNSLLGRRHKLAGREWHLEGAYFGHVYVRGTGLLHSGSELLYELQYIRIDYRRNLFGVPGGYQLIVLLQPRLVEF